MWPIYAYAFFVGQLWLVSCSDVNNAYVTSKSLFGPVGIGNPGDLTKIKPEFQAPRKEQNTKRVVWKPDVIYRPEIETNTLGYCIARQSWRQEGAIADHCPAGTTMNNQGFQSFGNQIVCTATKCAGPFGFEPKAVSIPQMKSSLAASKLVAALQQRQQFWGANIASTCNTIIVKPVYTCRAKCLVDNRFPNKDLCLCPDGYLPCPYQYTWCNCEGKPICAADPYYCTLYCNYAPSWAPGIIGKNICPLDPNTIDFTTANPIYPGWTFAFNNGLAPGPNIGRRLRAEEEEKEQEEREKQQQWQEEQQQQQSQQKHRQQQQQKQQWQEGQWQEGQQQQSQQKQRQQQQQKQQWQEGQRQEVPWEEVDPAEKSPEYERFLQGLAALGATGADAVLAEAAAISESLEVMTARMDAEAAAAAAAEDSAAAAAAAAADAAAGAPAPPAAWLYGRVVYPPAANAEVEDGLQPVAGVLGMKPSLRQHQWASYSTGRSTGSRGAARTKGSKAGARGAFHVAEEETAATTRRSSSSRAGVAYGSTAGGATAGTDNSGDSSSRSGSSRKGQGPSSNESSSSAAGSSSGTRSASSSGSSTATQPRHRTAQYSSYSTGGGLKARPVARSYEVGQGISREEGARSSSAGRRSSSSSAGRRSSSAGRRSSSSSSSSSRSNSSSSRGGGESSEQYQLLQQQQQQQQ